MTDKNTPEPTVDLLEQALAQLNTNQIRFLIARQDCGSDREAALAVGVSPNTVKDWKQKGAPLDEALRLMVADGLTTAMHLRRRHLGRAMAVKVAGLEVDDDRLRQNVATEIIEWEMGKATQKQEVAIAGEILVRIDDD
jgi:hypothetical protein